MAIAWFSVHATDRVRKPAKGTHVKLASIFSSVIAATVLASGPASAFVIFNYDQGQGLSSGGKVVFDGTKIVATNIGFDLMNASGTSLDGVYHCSTAGGKVTLGGSRCLLSFTTGNLISATPGAANTTTYVFGAGGSISMTGYLSTATPGNTAPIIGSSPLVVSGSFDAYTFVLQLAASGLSGSGTGAGLGFDFKDPQMVQYFGLNADDEFDFTTSQLAISGCSKVAKAAAGFSCNVNNADFQNTIMEPGTLALMGLGLLGIGLVRRRIG